MKIRTLRSFTVSQIRRFCRVRRGEQEGAKVDLQITREKPETKKVD